MNRRAMAARAVLVLAAPLLPGCLTAGAVRMLTHCDLERLDVHACSFHAPAAEVAWEGRCPGNLADDGPHVGPERAGRLRIPMPDPRCGEVELWAERRLTSDTWVSARTAAGAPSGPCVVRLRRDGGAITAVADDGRVLATSGVRDFTADPRWWLAVPDAFLMDLLVAGVGALSWPFTLLHRS